MDINSLKTDTNLEEDGVWTEVALFGQMLDLKIARLGNKAYERAKEARQKPYVQQIRQGTLSVDTEEKILIDCVARHVLKGWPDDWTYEGQPFPYSVENSVRILTENRDLLSAVVKASADAEKYRKQQIEADAGN